MNMFQKMWKKYLHKSVGDDMNVNVHLVTLHAQRIDALKKGDYKEVERIDNEIKQWEAKKNTQKANDYAMDPETSFVTDPADKKKETPPMEMGENVDNKKRSKAIDTSFAGPVPKTLLAEQDLEGKKKKEQDWRIPSPDPETDEQRQSDDEKKSQVQKASESEVKQKLIDYELKSPEFRGLSGIDIRIKSLATYDGEVHATLVVYDNGEFSDEYDIDYSLSKIGIVGKDFGGERQSQNNSHPYDSRTAWGSKINALSSSKRAGANSSVMGKIAKAIDNFVEIQKGGENNPWAICHAQGLTGDKFERCVMDIKAKQKSQVQKGQDPKNYFIYSAGFSIYYVKCLDEGTEEGPFPTREAAERFVQSEVAKSRIEKRGPGESIIDSWKDKDGTEYDIKLFDSGWDTALPQRYILTLNEDGAPLDEKRLNNASEAGSIVLRWKRQYKKSQVVKAINTFLKDHFDDEITSEENAHHHYHDLADKYPAVGSTLDSIAEDEAGHSRKLHGMEEVLHGQADEMTSSKSQLEKSGWDFEHGSFPSAAEVGRVLRTAGISVRVYPSSYMHHTSVEIDDKDFARAKKALRETGLLESWMKSQVAKSIDTFLKQITRSEVKQMLLDGKVEELRKKLVIDEKMTREQANDLITGARKEIQEEKNKSQQVEKRKISGFENWEVRGTASYYGTHGLKIHEVYRKLKEKYPFLTDEQAGRYAKEFGKAQIEKISKKKVVDAILEYMDMAGTGRYPTKGQVESVLDEKISDSDLKSAIDDVKSHFEDSMKEMTSGPDTATFGSSTGTESGGRNDVLTDEMYGIGDSTDYDSTTKTNLGEGRVEFSQKNKTMNNEQIEKKAKSEGEVMRNIDMRLKAIDLELAGMDDELGNRVRKLNEDRAARYKRLTEERAELAEKRYYMGITQRDKNMRGRNTFARKSMEKSQVIKVIDSFLKYGYGTLRETQYKGHPVEITYHYDQESQGHDYYSSDLPQKWFGSYNELKAALDKLDEKKGKKSMVKEITPIERPIDHLNNLRDKDVLNRAKEIYEQNNDIEIVRRLISEEFGFSNSEVSEVLSYVVPEANLENIDGRQLDPHSRVDQETSVGTTKDVVDERGRKIEQKVKGLQSEIKKLEDKRDKAHAGGFYELEDVLDDKITILEQRIVLTQMGKSQAQSRLPFRDAYLGKNVPERKQSAFRKMWDTMRIR